METILKFYWGTKVSKNWTLSQPVHVKAVADKLDSVYQCARSYLTRMGKECPLCLGKSEKVLQMMWTLNENHEGWSSLEDGKTV